MEKDKWGPRDFNQYLKELARTDGQKLLPLGAFPKKIESNDPFRSLISSMQYLTALSYREVGALIVSWNPAKGNPSLLHSLIDDSEPAALLVASPFFVGGEYSIDGELFVQTEKSLRAQGCSRKVVALHAHPTDPEPTDSFSNGDEAATLIEQNPVELLVNQDPELPTLMMCRSLQTGDFADYFVDLTMEEAGEILYRFAPNKKDQAKKNYEMNVAFARRFKSALYKGETDRCFTRIWPPIGYPMYKRLLWKLFPE